MSADERTLGERVAAFLSERELARQYDGDATNYRAQCGVADALLREQQAEIERLTGHNRELDPALISVNAAHDKLLTEHIAVMDERNQLRQDLEAVRVDAERYRWLTAVYFDGTTSAFRLVGPCRTPAELNAAIDAARARGEGNADD